ncbi:hypothetical protein BLNAU_3311 [Blattamonas nauphoetae]|uniref:Uncharacterized protein n=1 Tax=Blattamonas nauphoetae TaxID=2049346 RepID=A0ABQ9YDN2_9EUKA|nr:hypothetical protein BLNAU_3311 [Blattamonas nauphoetae]
MIVSLDVFAGSALFVAKCGVRRRGKSLLGHPLVGDSELESFKDDVVLTDQTLGDTDLRIWCALLNSILSCLTQFMKQPPIAPDSPATKTTPQFILFTQTMFDDFVLSIGNAQSTLADWAKKMSADCAESIATLHPTLQLTPSSSSPLHLD